MDSRDMRRLVVAVILTLACIGSGAEEPQIPAVHALSPVGVYPWSLGSMPYFEPSSTGIHYKLIVVQPCPGVEYSGLVWPGEGSEGRLSVVPEGTNPAIRLLRNVEVGHSGHPEDRGHH